MNEHRSGWCTAPHGARPQHEKCRASLCGCSCHETKASA